jgi:hypothetical protein
MALTNAEKQARWRERNFISLTDDAASISWKLMQMDQAKLRKLAKFINDHLKHPDRTEFERQIALGRIGMDGLNGRLTPKQAIEKLRNPEPKQDYSYRVEAQTADGRRWATGVRLKTVEEAQIYAEYYTYKLEGYVTSEVIRCDGESPLNRITRGRKGGRPELDFMHGTCGSLTWRPVT